MIKNLIKIHKILSKKDQTRLYFLVIIKFFFGILETISVLSFAPFLSALTNKNYLVENKYIIKVQNSLSLSEVQLIVLLSLVPLFLIILTNVLRSFITWFESKITNKIWYTIHSDLFNYYLNQQYLFHVKNSSNTLLERLLQRTNAAIAGVIYPMHQIIGNTFSASLIIILLIYLNPSMAVILILFIGFFYFTLYRFFKKKISDYGSYSPKFAQMMFKLVGESLKSIKDIKIRNNSEFFLKQFKKNAAKYCDNAVNFDFFLVLPRTVTEIFAFSFIFFITLILLYFQNYEFSKIVVLLGLYIVGMHKLLPVIQNFFQQFTSIKFWEFSFSLIYDDLKKAHQFKKEVDSKDAKDRDKIFKNEINFKNIKYSYPNNEKFEFRIEKFHIKKGETIGIIGDSGSGKTTFINILTGLIDKNFGEIIIDDTSLDILRIKNFQKIISYVPQSVFILDDTIKKNIALGISENLITMDKIRYSAKMANISDFIENDLINGYETIVGEDAIKLSGGERQRIGIARSLYDDKDLIILDEATNALDEKNELKVISNIKSKKDKTILIVSHNYSILKNLDRIISFKDGKLTEIR